jgi:hypothetical protein
MLATAAAPARAAVAAPVEGGGSGPLGIVDATLVQTDVRMSLRITSSGDWTAPDLRTAGRALCVTLVDGEPATARGRICVTAAGQQGGLSYAALAGDGSALAARRLAAVVSRPAPRVLEATFLPADAGLRIGPYAWWAQSTWTDAAGCASRCTDRFPDGDGVVSANVALLAFPPCFGAAARDPRSPCDNPDLRLTVEPTVARAAAILKPYCDTQELVGLLSVCEFGAPRDDMPRKVALIGDSHAASLKTALHVVTLAEHWRGVSMFRSGCPATLAPAPIVQTPARSRQCVRWNRQVLEWLRAHSEVDTVVLSAHAAARVAPHRGQSKRAAIEAGYRAEIRALLERVRRVVVIRDSPGSVRGQLGCVSRALSARRPPGPACAQPRDKVLRRDPLVVAAGAVRSPHVKVIDLTSHICDRARCYPVVGGALVHRDVHHLTPAFSASLGPFILRALHE